MYILKAHIPEFKALTREQRKTVASAYHRKCYRWVRNTLPQIVFFFLGLWAIYFLKRFTERGFEITFVGYLVLKYGYKLILTILETNGLAKSPEFIQKYKNFEWGF